MTVDLPLPLNPTLEAAVATNPNDVVAWSVYADWLQAQGHPLGERISLDLQRDDGSTAPHIDRELGALEHERLEHHLGSELMGILLADELDPGLELIWKCGFVVDVRLRSLATLDSVQGLLRAPVGRFLRRVEFALGLVPWPDPSADIRKGRESAWTDIAIWASFAVAGVEQRMRWIEPGIFIMDSELGEPPREYGESTPHQVTLTRGFWLADTPCTQGLWTAVMSRNPSWFRGSLERPVERVSWDDVQGFLARLSGMGAGGFRLPTEAQWEYACRAGTATAIYGDLDEVAWYWDNSRVEPNEERTHESRRTHDVKLKKPNAWGLYDMLGNVAEWCADEWRVYTAKAVIDPVGIDPAEPCKMVRGGSWLSRANRVRATDRVGSSRDFRARDMSFRLARGSGEGDSSPKP